MQSIYWVALCALVLFCLQGLLLGRFALHGVTYTRTFSHSRAHEGDEIEMVEVISNRKLLPVPWVKIESRIPSALRVAGSGDVDIAGDMYHRSTFSLAPYQRITRRHKVRCIQRGCYDTPSASMSAGDLLAMHVQTRTVAAEGGVTVYPGVIPAEEISLPSLRWQGDLVVRRYIMPDIFLYGGIRGYIPGDPLRSVHWGASAATGELKVKQYDYTAMPRLLLVLNVQPSEDVWDAISPKDKPDIENGLRVAASLAEHLIRNGMDVGFASNGRIAGSDETVLIAPSSGHEQLEELLETMARLEIYRRRSFHQFLGELPVLRETDLLLISCYRSALTEAAVGDIVARGNSAAWYLLRNEATDE